MGRDSNKKARDRDVSTLHQSKQSLEYLRSSFETNTLPHIGPGLEKSWNIVQVNVELPAELRV